MNATLPRAWLVVAGGWAAVLLAVTLFRPVMPVDETRYLTVAWEMMRQGHWLLPTVNFEPYSHKPPLLFWIVRLAWEIGGAGVTPARIAMGCVIMALFHSSARLARSLAPGLPSAPAHTMLLLASLPLFIVYASTIMFDSLLACFVVIAWIGTWHAQARPGPRPWLLVGAALGMGILAKGPVALVYTLFPALLAPIWAGAQEWRRWYKFTGLAFLIGTAMALAWAVPAAITGGHAYAEKIFVTQSAGRMVNAFDHVRPFWFYLPVAAAFLAPLLLWPDMWRALKGGARSLFTNDRTGRAARFLLCGIVPVFLFFSLISSKQAHYLVPLLPGVCALASLLLAQERPPRFTAVPVLLSALPSLVLLGERAFVALGAGGVPRWAQFMDGFLPALAVGHIALAAFLAFMTRRAPAFATGWTALASVLLIACLHAQAGQSLLPRYSMEPLRAALEPYRERPLAVLPKYDGEYGFTLRLTQTVDVLNGETENDARAWLAAHPDGLIIVRDDFSAPVPDDYTPLFSMRFREKKRLSLVAARP